MYFQDTEHLKIPMESQHSTKDITCSTCSRTFAAMQELSAHENSERHETLHQCDMCDKGTVNYWSSIEHNLQFTCEICGKEYRHSSSLSCHRAQHRTNQKQSCLNQSSPKGGCWTENFMLVFNLVLHDYANVFQIVIMI